MSPRAKEGESGDTAGPPFPPRSFDTVMVINLLHVLEEPRRVLDEAGRLMKDGGTLVAVTFCHGHSYLSRAASALMQLTGFRARHKWTVAGFRTFVRQAGFAVRRERVLRGVVPMLYLEAARPEGGSP